MSDDIKATVASTLAALGIGTPAQPGALAPATAPAPAGPPPAPATGPAQPFDLQQLKTSIAAEVVEQLRGAGHKPTMAELLAGRAAPAAAAAAPGAPARRDISGGTPRRVSELETDGIIDVLSLTRDEQRALGPERIVQEWEKQRAVINRTSGRPPLPKALRESNARRGR